MSVVIPGLGPMWSDLVTIPVFTALIGYITNWTGVWMLFHPLTFRGVRVPGLRVLFPLLPRRMQVLPALRFTGHVGWQGIVPSRAAKMASLAVDKGLAKLGSASDFYRELEPDRIAEQLTATVDERLEEIVDDLMAEEDPRLWAELPPVLKDAVYTRVRRALPGLVATLTARIGEHVESLIDAKLMVVSRLEARPELLNAIFQGLGAKELRFIQNFGLYLGLPLGVGLFAVLHYYPAAWVLPVGGAVIGWVVNYLGVTMIFEPVLPRSWVPWKQGLFLKRQSEVTDGYATLISEHVITLENVGHELLHGPRADRTMRLLGDTLRPAVDRAVGPARSAVQAALGPGHYDRIRAGLAREAAGVAPNVFSDRQFGAGRPAASTTSSPGGCTRWVRTTSCRCCARPSSRTSGYCSCTVAYSASPPGSCTSACLECDVGMTEPPEEYRPLPGLARLSVAAARRTLGRGTSMTTSVLHTGTDILDRVRRGDPPLVISRDLVDELRDVVDTALAGRRSTAGAVVRGTGEGSPEDLRARGAALLARSADVSDPADDIGHPAYLRMLAEITPDEARILRLLYASGPQPAVDVRTNRPLGVGSELIAGGLNMLAQYAGLRRTDRIHPYLTNLNRQGLVAFSKEKVGDPDRYQLIEAQPDVAAALRRAGRAPKIVYRSIRLTTFGRDFCQACFPLNPAGRTGR
jgi:uncharacterized membrane protein YheB (UPF0754 family)